METILVRPRDGRALEALQSFLGEMKDAFTSRARPDTLEAKITGLYEEGYYTDSELERFFSIPKKYRADPFEVSPSGDVYWADKRNVDDLDTSLAHVKNGLVKKLSREDQKAFLGL